MNSIRRITEVAGLAPASGPYSFAVIIGNQIQTAGQIGQNPEGVLVAGGIAAQTDQVMRNLGNILVAAGSGFDHVTKTKIYLTDVNDFALVNEIYAGYFTGEYPPRVTIGAAALPLGALIEVEMEAVLNPNPHLQMPNATS